MSFKETLETFIKDYLKEDSMYDMINHNTDNSNVAEDVIPGEFSNAEITNLDNLVNVAKLSNQTDYDNKATKEPLNVTDNIEDVPVNDEMTSIDISVEDDDTSSEEEKCKIHKLLQHVKDMLNDDETSIESFKDNILHTFESVSINSDSKLTKDIYSALKESDYAGPLDFVPDTRINTSDVLNKLKELIGKGSEAIHVDQDYDNEHNSIYRVSMIDKDLLPNKIQVETTILELNDDKDCYIPNKISDNYPLKK